MQKLIITVTADSTVSYPTNPHAITSDETRRLAQEYIDGVAAGAAIAHLHGARRLEKEIQADGRKMSRLDLPGWQRLQEGILEKCRPIVQFGVAAARLEERKKLLELAPDMMSVSFNGHDEHFQPDSSVPANDIYASHPREELLEYARVLREHGVRPEIECFHTGAIWNLEYVRAHEALNEPLWCSFFLGWPGGTWTPPTAKALQYMVDNLPPGCQWNLSVMNPDAAWGLIALAIELGGHVRVGWEDNPFDRPNHYAEANAKLVEKAVRLAAELGRDVASPDEARAILNMRGSASHEAEEG